MNLRAFVLTLLAAASCGGEIVLAQAPGGLVEPVTVVTEAQASPVPGQGSRGRSTAPAPPTAPAPAPRVRTGTDEPPPPPPPPPVGEGRVPAPRRQGQPLNIRVDATITDQQGSAPPVKKTLSVVVADGSTGSVRTLSTYANAGVGNVPLNMDAETTILPDGKLRLSLRLQYDLPSPAMLGRPAGSEERQPTKTSIVEGLNLVVENGKSIVAAQSADPVSDRQVVVEVKATLLK
jgi:hypothetical protein